MLRTTTFRNVSPLLIALALALGLAVLTPAGSALAASGAASCDGNNLIVRLAGWGGSAGITIRADGGTIKTATTDSSGNATITINGPGYWGNLTANDSTTTVALGTIACSLWPNDGGDPNGRYRINAFVDEVIAVYCFPIGTAQVYIEFWLIQPLARQLTGISLGEFVNAFRGSNPGVITPFGSNLVLLGYEIPFQSQVYGQTGYPVTAALGSDNNTVTVIGSQGTKTFQLTTCAGAAGRSYSPLPPINVSLIPDISTGNTSNASTVSTTVAAGGTSPTNTTSTTTGTSSTGTYIVKSGDTLYLISLRFGVGLQALIDANPQLLDPSLIYVGDIIIIP